MNLNGCGLGAPLEHTDQVFRHSDLRAGQRVYILVGAELGECLPLLVIQTGGGRPLWYGCVLDDCLWNIPVPEDTRKRVGT